mmetsp:Transcript_21353/g.36134  ORF Transcript_21353/g.36134 Transcript_21353/m.36134 type:complete len:415 (-) Transcript_21353:175-1419(-)
MGAIASSFIIVGSLLSALQGVEGDYVGAVAEHTTYMGKTGDHPELLLKKNLDIYEGLISIAAKNGANVLVFPEFGLTATAAATRSDLYPFAEVIPEISDTLICPCEQEDDFVSRPILYRMSCAARKAKILVLVNTIDWQSCDPQDDANCPTDLHYQYNTDVLFDEQGYLVAKYHKSHEWPPFKPVYDQPLNPSQVTYKSKFGVTFGLFICFDIVFDNPPQSLLAEGVTHFLYAVAQGIIGETLLITPWSYWNSATMLSANLGSGWKDCSGIIVNGSTLPAKKVYLQDENLLVDFPDENVLIATVPAVQSAQSTHEQKKEEDKDSMGYKKEQHEEEEDKPCASCTSYCSLVPPSGTDKFPCYRGSPKDAAFTYTTDPLLKDGTEWHCGDCADFGYPTYLHNDPLYKNMELWAEHE